MLEEKKALRAKALANATLTTKLGGQHVYQAEQDMDVETLLAGGAAAIVTFSCIADSPSTEIPYAERVYQFDVWSQSADTADEVAEIVDATFRWDGTDGSGTLPGLTTRRLAEPITSEPGARDMPRDQSSASLHHRIRAFRVATYAA